MRERPILFSAPMVRAILEGRKMQTRRILKNPEFYGCPTGDCPHTYQAECQEAMQGIIEKCPHGKPGDRLWVRESFSYSYSVDNDPERRHLMPVWYWADGNPSSGDYGKPRPSIHHPRWASRILLEITDVRVERLNDISEADAIAEGATARPKCSGYNNTHDGWSMDWSRVGQPSKFCASGVLADKDVCLGTPQAAFGNLWESINGPGSWALNPWVWAVSFQRVDAAAVAS